ncbi:MAG: YhfC family intramembrane metalloprotease [Chloroflexi bacterium]|nr:YhfC family intramembrane metalloprotease [Ktedonobacteraceae bacterium]MBV9707243.1 YhfC family intramembrane metalloprotease [Chloroflexota bacterium]
MGVANWLAFIVLILVAIVGPFVLAGVFRKRLGVPLSVFFIAAVFYILILVIEQPFFLLVQVTGIKNQILLVAVFLPLIFAFCEETMRYLSFRVGPMRRNRTADGALMAGVGHGGMEAIYLAFVNIAPVLFALIAPQLLIRGQPTVIQVLHSPWFYIFIATSRIEAIPCHLSWATLSVMAYRRSPIFFPLAILGHFVIDSTTFSVLDLMGSVLWTQVLFAGWAILSLLLIVYVRRTGILATQHTESAPGVAQPSLR